MNGIHLKKRTEIYELFKTMNLTIGVDSDKSALAWLEKHGKVFCGYVSGRWLQKEKDITSETTRHEVYDIFSGKHLCDLYVCADNKLLSHAAESSSAGFKTWSTMTPTSRSKILYNIAQTLEKYQTLFATVEAVSSGKHFSRVKAKDVPNLIQSFNYYACCAAQLEKDWFSTGPICVVAEEYNNPSLTISLRVSSILASGCSVLILADVKSSLSSFLLAEICSESGLPEGVLNVIPINQERFNSLGQSSIFSKLVFTGSLERGISFSKLSAEAHIPCDVLIPKRPVVIVYDDADLDSAAKGVMEAFFSHDTRSKSSGCKVMVQESVAENFLQLLKYRFSTILVGENMSKTDMSCIVTEEQKKVLTQYVAEAREFTEDIKINSDLKENTWKYPQLPPILISDLSTNFKLVHEELGGPIIVVFLFRTVKESISMFNRNNKGSPVSIWVNQVAAAMEVALKLKTGVIWTNSENFINARAPFTGVYFSGNSVVDGKEALLQHMSVTVSEENMTNIKENYEQWLSSSNKFEKSESSAVVAANSSLKEYKLFIGGIFKSSNAIKYDDNILIPSATESDTHNAVSSAVAAQPKWESLTDLQKRKIFFAVIDKLKKVKDEYVAELHKFSKNSLDECEKEFDLALDLLYDLATQDDNFCGPVQEIKQNCLALQKRYPLGVVGIQCPDEKPLLSFLLLIFQAIDHGNAVVAIASGLYPTIAFKMCETFSSANVPSGVINVICGNNKRLVPALCQNVDVNAMWFSDVPPKIIYSNSHATQRLFCCNKIWTDFNKAKNLKCAVECTYTKTIFLPFGGIFSN